MTFWHLISRQLKRRWGRAVFLALSLFLVAAVTTALFTASRAMQVEVANSYDQIGANISIVPANDNLSIRYGGVTVTPDEEDAPSLTDGALDRIRGIHNAESIARVAPKVMGIVPVTGEPTTIVGVSFRDELKMKKWWTIDGDRPSEAADIIVGSALAHEKGWQKGQVIGIDDDNHTPVDQSTVDHRYRITGILTPTGGEEDHLLFMDWRQAQQVLQIGNRLTFIEVSALCSSCPIEEITRQIGHTLPGTEVKAVKEALVAREAIVDRFTALSLLVAAITLIGGSLLVFLLVAASVRERTREFGLLRALGYRKSHLLRVLLAETALLALPAGVAGYGAGLAFARWTTPLIVQMDISIASRSSDAFVAATLTLLVGLAASALPAWQGATKDPVEALRSL
ncbi:FtsX-like permease family protein [Heliobacterium gestii]|uniref:FtsX-like permease family protein n=1 Tax=Heliomicrobium gestii TaxID=2699 RepID=A0A845LAK7_HELGE|nr:FtsX-like permease family protein [Heliomicrobium gestii]MBM7865294.1 putative ABC transport system permease protein [Heliomicrobium gestii]MZP41555.1 FtsX-like permease family protein [Heliomicrobium gestii]